MTFPRISTVSRSPAPLFKWISTRLTDDMVLWIAHKDYGRDANEHFAALKTIRDAGEIKWPLSWVPHEVLALSRAVATGQTTYREAPPIGPEEAYLIKAFACAALLYDQARKGRYHAGNDELCRLLTALKFLGNDALAAGLPFLAWIGEQWPGGLDSRAFFAVALVWLALRSRANVADEDISRLIAFAIEEEAKEFLSSGKGRGPHPERWLIGTTVYGYTMKCWRRIGSDLRADADAVPGNKARNDILHLGDLLVDGLGSVRPLYGD